ncbi:hypothetical protein NDU88_011346, partial [Pleurodeles waltl]
QEVQGSLGYWDSIRRKCRTASVTWTVSGGSAGQPRSLGQSQGEVQGSLGYWDSVSRKCRAAW